MGEIERLGRISRLVVMNVRNGEARTMEAQLDGQPLEQHPLVIGGERMAMQLVPGRRARVPLVVVMNTPPRVRAPIT